VVIEQWFALVKKVRGARALVDAVLESYPEAEKQLHEETVADFLVESGY